MIIGSLSALRRLIEIFGDAPVAEVVRILQGRGRVH